MAAMLEGRTPPPVEAGQPDLVGDRLPPGEPGQARSRSASPTGRPPLPDSGSTPSSTDTRPSPASTRSTSAKAGFAQAVAVNLDPLESQDRRRWAVETLEKLGVPLWRQAGAVEALDREHLRQLQNAELEGRQKLWRA